MFKVIQRYIKSCPQKCFCSTKTDISKTEMPKELTKKTDITSKVELANSVKKEDLQWRTPWHQKEGQYYSTLRTFYTEDNNVNVMKFLQQPVNLTPSAIKNWWARRKENTNRALQSYIPERNQTLGNELAAAHFIVHRGGSVKFFGEDRWIKANEYQEYSLPRHFDGSKVLQAIDCTGVDLFFEGLANFRGLKQLEWFSANGCDRLDDWAVDRISSIFMHTLLYLDLRNCPGISYRGLSALYKMDSLKILYLDDITQSRELEMTCLLLQELNPQLDIREY